MYINCKCGGKIYDITDGHRDKARWLPDKDWDNFIWALDSLSKMKDETDEERDRAVFNVLKKFKFQTMHQCESCGSIFIFNKGDNKLNIFESNVKENSSTIFSDE